MNLLLYFCYISISSIRVMYKRHIQGSCHCTGLWHWWEELAVSGWAATRVGAAQQGSRPLAVGLTLSSYPDGAADAWAISLSRYKLSPAVVGRIDYPATTKLQFV